MAIDTKTPMALYKANLELVMRLGALLQENRRRWTRFGVASADEAIERTLSETGRMLTTNDWQALANLPGETFWKAVQGEPGPMQGAVETAVGNQSAFAQGLQEAFGAWQQQCSEVIREAGGKLPSFSFEGVLRGIGTPRPAAAAAAAAPASPAASRTTAASKPAVKRAPSKAVKAAKAAKKSAPAKKSVRKPVAAPARKAASTAKTGARKAVAKRKR
jgi:hypothetical protein